MGCVSIAVRKATPLLLMRSWVSDIYIYWSMQNINTILIHFAYLYGCINMLCKYV